MRHRLLRNSRRVPAGEMGPRGEGTAACAGRLRAGSCEDAIVAMEGTMKQILLAASIAACTLSLTGLAIAQTVALPKAEAPGEQLQRVPVSGLHIGPPGHVKNPYEGNKNAWME